MKLIPKCNSSGFFFILMVIFFSGCGTTRNGFYLESGRTELPKTSFVVGEMDFGKPKNVANAIAMLYGSTLQEELKKAGLMTDPPLSGGESLRLDTFLVEYDAGNLAERWLFGGIGGYGAAYAELLVNIMDSMTGQRVGALHIQTTIDCCGLLSAGAENKVIQNAARAVVSELKKKKVKKGVSPGDLDFYERANGFGIYQSSSDHTIPRRQPPVLKMGKI